jgi:hypothetical protein
VSQQHKRVRDPSQRHSSPVRIGVKHLAREFDRRPKWVREQLRRDFGGRPIGSNWEWKEGRDADKIRQWLRTKLDGGVR